MPNDLFRENRFLFLSTLNDNFFFFFFIFFYVRLLFSFFSMMALFTSSIESISISQEYEEERRNKVREKKNDWKIFYHEISIFDYIFTSHDFLEVFFHSLIFPYCLCVFVYVSSCLLSFSSWLLDFFIIIFDWFVV